MNCDIQTFQNTLFPDYYYCKKLDPYFHFRQHKTLFPDYYYCKKLDKKR